MMARTADKLIEQIKQDIAMGVLKPGDQLEEAILSQKFGVSRTPIREAIRAMVDCGVLETRPRKGAIVRILSAKELLDLFEVAAELEAMASRLAAASLTEHNAALIKARVDDCCAAADANDQVKYSAANLALHAAIHKASGNLALVEQLDQLQMHINPYRAMPYQIRGRLASSNKEHDEIYHAILNGDERAACDLMRDHMMLQGKRLPSIIQSLQERAKGE
ncbi:MAG: DNA-binding GntR family transcriptional regulator [bacterium]|jgi:DNA-binding GntR family transcriptional regulator